MSGVKLRVADIAALVEQFPAGMSGLEQDGAWVYVKDYEKCSRILSRLEKQISAQPARRRKGKVGRKMVVRWAFTYRATDGFLGVHWCDSRRAAIEHKKLIYHPQRAWGPIVRIAIPAPSHRPKAKGEK